jgi:hypothetical protein
MSTDVAPRTTVRRHPLARAFALMCWLGVAGAALVGLGNVTAESVLVVVGAILLVGSVVGTGLTVYDVIDKLMKHVDG